MPEFDGDSAIEIDAPIDAVFEVVADLERVGRWQPDVKSSACLERDRHGRATLVLVELETPGRNANVHLRVAYDAPTLISWVMEHGDVRAFSGSWSLRDLGGDRTHAAYAVTIDFGGKLGMLMRGPAAKAIGNTAVSSMPRKLKDFVESGPIARGRRPTRLAG